MNAKIKQLRDLVVALDRADRNIEPMTPEAYRDAARAVLELTHEEMGMLPIADFAGPVTALQSMAENLFFDLHGSFADVDGSGRAPLASSETRALLGRIRPGSAVPGAARATPCPSAPVSAERAVALPALPAPSKDKRLPGELLPLLLLLVRIVLKLHQLRNLLKLQVLAAEVQTPRTRSIAHD